MPGTRDGSSVILVVDDEPNIVFSVTQCLTAPGQTVVSAQTARDGIELCRTRRPDVVLLDVRLPDLSGLDAFEQLRRIDPRLPCIIMTAYSRTETAIEAMRRGAFEYLVKPVDLHQLRELVAKAVAVSRLNRIPAVVDSDAERDDADCIVGHSTAMREVYKAIGRMAPQDATVLILGESGTGKELVARAIYHYSRRGQHPFLAINCAALPETLLESELFGHERGAFTGADQRRIGKFEQVSGGTIFLDEIGDMSPATQAKALRLLQEQRFERLGGSQTVQTDVRIIAATNRDLPKMVEAGTFRQDLLYRLNGFTITLPPLRERREDLPVLTEHMVRRLCHELDRPPVNVTAEVWPLLRAHDWPGNVRELESAIRYAVVQAAGNVITPDCLPESCRKSTVFPRDEAPVAARFEEEVTTLVRAGLERHDPGLYQRLHARWERVVLDEVMRFTTGNQVQAAQLLGISRMTLRSKLRQAGLIPDKGGAEDGEG